MLRALVEDGHRAPAERLAHVFELLVARKQRLQLPLDRRERVRKRRPRAAARVVERLGREAREVAADHLVLRVLAQLLWKRCVLPVGRHILAHALQVALRRGREALVDRLLGLVPEPRAPVCCHTRSPTHTPGRPTRHASQLTRWASLQPCAT
eukprot:2942360-Prymnesium_polylepis.2